MAKSTEVYAAGTYVLELALHVASIAMSMEVVPEWLQDLIRSLYL